MREAEQCELPISKLPPVIYIAGPFRAKQPGNHWQQVQNIRRAEQLAWAVWERGYAAICPHMNTENYQGSLPDHVWLDGDLAILAKCDGVLMTPDWAMSSGATAERDFAVQHGIPVYYSISELTPWATEARSGSRG